MSELDQETHNLTEEQLAELDARVKAIGDRQRERQARRTLWLSHHWPDAYEQRCFKIGSKHVCRRCASLYPLALVVATVSLLGQPIWPDAWDTTAIWLVALPGTVAYVGEALGFFSYRPQWQVAATLITALAFGKGLGYELDARWSYEFWAPLVVFGAIWFSATVANSVWVKPVKAG